jgi:hypothetical protein
MVPSTFLKNVKSTAKVTGAYLSTIPPPHQPEGIAPDWKDGN